MLRMSGAGDSTSGLVRDHNEDSAFLGPTCALVADGVGGGAAGEVASATTAYAVSAVALAGLGRDPVEVLREGIRLAEAQVALGVEADPRRTGMASTLTALATDGRRFALAHLGDSRGYLFRDDELVRITRDHTYVQDLVDDGRLTVADARVHPWRNVVLRTVNGEADGEPDLQLLDLRPGDRVVLASDGVTDLVAESVITATLRRHDDDTAVTALVDAALAAGGNDNITCLVATVVDGPPIVPDGVLLGAVSDPANVVDVTAARGGEAAG